MAKTGFDFGYRALLVVQLAILLISNPSAAEDKAPAAGKDDIERRIESVSNGLLPAIAIAGQAPASMKLSARMTELNISGVSVAVIRGGGN